MADAVEIEFCRNRLRFKSLHYEDQMRLMKDYLLFGQMPFECMTSGQKTDFKRMAKKYAIEKGTCKLMKQVTSKKCKDGRDNEHRKFHSYLHSVISPFNIHLCNKKYETIPNKISNIKYIDLVLYENKNDNKYTINFRDMGQNCM